MAMKSVTWMLVFLVASTITTKGNIIENNNDKSVCHISKTHWPYLHGVERYLRFGESIQLTCPTHWLIRHWNQNSIILTCNEHWTTLPYCYQRIYEHLRYKPPVIHLVQQSTSAVGDWLGILALANIFKKSIGCDPISDPEHGESSCSDSFSVGSTCEVTCESGYKLTTGDDAITCDSPNNPSYSGPIECTEVCLKSNIDQDKYDLTNCQESTIPGDGCVLNCAAGYFNEEGLDTVMAVCGDDGWEYSNPCIEVCFKSDIDDKYVSINCQEMTIPGHFCQLNCAAGHANEDPRKPTHSYCQNDGNWEYSNPCIPHVF